MNLAFDLDGVILDFDMELWLKFKQRYFGTLNKKAVRTMKKLREREHYIIIHSCRINNTQLNKGYSIEKLYEHLRRLLDYHEIPYDEIWTDKGKPLAMLYPDDRGFRIDGPDSWEKILPLVKEIEGLPARYFNGQYFKGKLVKNE